MFENDFYKIIDITDKNGYTRADGRYPLRIGRICVKPIPIIGYPLLVNYVKDRDGSDYNRSVLISRCISYEVKNHENIIIVYTNNSKYVFEKVNKIVENNIKNSHTECCGTCVFFNGEIGDGEQFCDELECDTHETRWCNRYQCDDYKIKKPNKLR